MTANTVRSRGTTDGFMNDNFPYFFCLAVAKFDLVHDEEAIHDLCLLTESGNLF